MSLKTIVAVFFITALSIFGFAYFSNKTSARQEFVEINPAYKEYISAFTSGYVSVENKIVILLAQDTHLEIEIGKSTDNDLFKFSPSIEGKITWLDKKTIEFTPSQKLSPNQRYKATFQLSDVLEVPDELKGFEFDFSTIKQAFEWNIEEFRSSGENQLDVGGTLNTADFSEFDLIEKVLMASQKGTSKKIEWVHENSTIHHFTIRSVVKGQGALDITYNGEVIGADEKGNKEIEIPKENVFSLMNVIVNNEPEQFVLLQFADPIDNTMDPEGLINISGSVENNNVYDDDEGEGSNEETTKEVKSSFLIENNTIKVYTSQRYSGLCQVYISDKIKNKNGKYLNQSYQKTIEFEDLKPAVRISGKGVILPESQNLIFPFEAVNLNAVDVRITKIYENNILQFLQVNSLDGKNELRRVGKLVIKKKIKLQVNGDPVKNKWNKYSLDLSSLIKTEPGALYNVRLSFNRNYSTYSCTDTTDNNGSEEDEYSDSYSSSGNDVNNEEKDWDYYSSYDDYYDDYYYYDYRNRNNPCSKAYYNNKSVTRNILATNIGLIAKRGNNGKISVFCSDLLTAKPMSNVVVEAYDYQQQKMKTSSTNGDGMAWIDSRIKPFVIIAKKGNERTYLKMDDGNSLSLSMFEVGGDEVQKGIKGFIYGERGVWRPGDSLFLSFILENKDKLYPENFPASLELCNPMGQMVQKIVKTKHVDGFYNFSTKTDVTAPTGVYLAKVKVGGATFTKSIRIESIMPNRLKLNLDFKEPMIYSTDLALKSKLLVNWLHGAPGKNLEVKMDASLNQTLTEFKGYKEYVFDNPAQNFYSETQTVFTGRTDENGEVMVNAPLNDTKQSPGFLNANFTIRAFEEGGGFSTDRFTVQVSPYSHYVGIKVPQPGKQGYLETDEDHLIQIATIDEYGKTANNRPLEVKVYKIDWRWWWDNYNEDLSSYIGNNYHQPVYSEQLISSGGKASFNLRVNQPGWGRYLIYVKDQESGHACGKVVYMDWPSWAGKSPKGNEGATMLSFSTDKTDYKVGETAKVIIPSPQGGKALINVENGSRVILSKWIETDKGTTTFELPVTKEMTPNVYIYVHLIQPHAQTLNDLPMRLYGVVPIMVKDENTILHPNITTASVWKPESVAEVKVSEENGREMAYTLAVVDEGLLDLTRFKTPDPWSAFYAKEALGVKTWDIFDQVIGAFSNAMSRILSIGGDDAMGKNPENSAQRFKPMVRFVGPFHLKKGETAVHKINIPQYVGSVRVMVVAGYQGAYGNAEKAVPVRKPLMILSTLPRVLGPGEEVNLPVTVFAMEKKVKNANITIQTDGLVNTLDGHSKTVSFKSIGDKVVSFKLKVKDALGVSKIKITANGAGEVSSETIEIAVRANNPVMTEAQEIIVSKENSYQGLYEPFGLKGTNKAYVEISTLPAINLSQRLNYLMEYPHGCVEQTTSSVFAALYLNDLIELNQNQKNTIDHHIKAAIQRLKSFQTLSGGLSYWPGLNHADDWGTNYAGHFLLEAQSKGYSLPYGLLDHWKKYQKNKAQSYVSNRNTAYYGEDLNQAYRLYTLALAKAPELSAMNRMKENASLSTEAKWRLAAAYALIGQIEVAKKLVNQAITPAKNRIDYYYTYGSFERDEAMILETMILLKDNSNAFLKVKSLSNKLGQNEYWMSTQTTAYCLMSIAKYAKTNTISSSINATCIIGNETLTLNDFNKYKFKQIEIKPAEKNQHISVKVNGAGNLFVRLVRQGVAKAGNETSQFNNLEMNVKYTTLSGNPIDVAKLEQGTDFIAEVNIHNPGIRGWYKNMALSQIFASGWEIRNQRMDNITYMKGDIPTYQDIRDDRVYSYFDISAGASKTFKVMLNASYAGKFYLPGISCEAMYDHGILAHLSGQWVEIVKSGELP